eukprot:CAMPEP_0202853000 /NCGR_PEP_ID=MMETSP1389-20130828/90256_1 /ASSEMBLY_ACC=CAM_ASM_000865 /TAXON_ID=302021 /ORGANISM="Rhodomonas sp., Strain CCMP768" /LENGTH=268 /DNA_ID=CAMNT_0049531537 /DNA_START=110 /DNA_END=917 /DNA_ORIENTATION=+
MIRSSAYVLGGVVAGVALTENKEAVGDFLYSAGSFLKSFATELRNVEVSGSKLGEVPGLGQTLEYVSQMELKRESLQLGVDGARTALTDVVRRSNTQTSKSTAVTPAPSSSSFQLGVDGARTALTDVVRRSNTQTSKSTAVTPAPSSSSSSLPGYLTLGLLVAVPTSIYLYVDVNAREQAQKLSQQAMVKVKEGLGHLELVTKDEAYRKQILARISSDVKEASETAGKYYTQGKQVAQEQLQKLLQLIQEQLNKAGIKKDSFRLFDST